MTIIKKNKIFNTIGGLLVIFRGLLMFAREAGFSGTIKRVLALSFGAFALVFGILYLYHKKLVPGLLGLFLGIRIVAFAITDYWVAILCIGFLLFVEGVALLSTKHISSGVLRILTSVLALCLAFGYHAQWSSLHRLGYLGGLFLVMDGIFLRTRR